MDLQTKISMICQRLASFDQGQVRVVVAIAGPPASGKSTVAAGVVERLNNDMRTTDRAVILPMDGYHLNNNVLEDRGLLNRKGAPETFDADGYCSLVKRLTNRAEPIFYPVFDRSLDMAIAGAGVINPEIDIVVVEGNYLLMRTAPWSSVYPLYDLTVSINPPMDVLENRLLERWLEYGYDEEGAREKIDTNDLPNARTIISHSVPAQCNLN